MTDLFLATAPKGAIFSDDRKYRYALWRIWDDTKPLVMFIGLNPSTANEDSDDPTIRRVKKFASEWGYGGVYMMNLFGIVSSDPSVLLTADNPIGDNNEYLEHISRKCSKVIFAWGAFQVNGRDKVVADMFPDAYALLLNKNGSPRHPLYVPANVTPIKFL